MEEQELTTKTDLKTTPEKQGQGTDEGTGMGAIWDIQRFRRLLDRAKAKRLAGEALSRITSEDAVNPVRLI
jgi:hypothetical protein